MPVTDRPRRPPAVARSGLEPRTRIQFLPGVGPARAQTFERLELRTLEQLVRHYPRTWLDASRFVKVRDLVPGQLLTVSGEVHRAAQVRTRGGRTDFLVTFRDDTGEVACYFFGQGFLARVLRPGVRAVVSGELDAFDRRMQNPMFEVVEGEVEDLLHAGRLIPIHPLTKGITGRGMRRAVRMALDAIADQVADPLPADVVTARGFGPLGDALREIHFPATETSREQARRRLAYEELFLLQSVLELRRAALRQEGRGLALDAPGTMIARARAALPFTLTGDQARSLDEILRDLRAPHPMQRLLLGDVGSGKTVVAFLAALHAIEAGHQVAFMAPTEILARQHAARLAPWAEAAGAPLAVLTGATPAAERRALAARCEAGEPLLLLGTHALIEDKVSLPALGLAIVDEQHRFGVRQRATLAHKAVMPDVLVLTATPIPRTLQLAYFGDLEVSRLAARPAGRGRLVTRVVAEERFPQVVDFLAKELAAGRQAYVVVPAIEEGGKLDVRAAEAEHRRLASHPQLRRHAVALLHGRLKADEKQRVMDGFASGAIPLLVATTVVEVGVDVPNATLMIVENAERFGLTQLHQLRGRVGRGAARSVCVLLPGPGASARARERLAVLAKTDDGFAIAEEDLRLRGAGEPWGTRQSGVPRMRLADFVRDVDLLERARMDARAVVERDPLLREAAHERLLGTLLTQYADAIELAIAG
jgi:ATP-dependent DNA helicase RecG